VVKVLQVALQVHLVVLVPLDLLEHLVQLDQAVAQEKMELQVPQVHLALQVVQV